MTLAGLFGLLMMGAAFAGEPTECDRLAGSPTDPNRVGTGIGLYWIEPAEAVSACERALSTDPNNLRLLFDLGRAHEAAMFLSGFLPGSTQAADSWVEKCKPDGRQATVSASIRHGTVKAVVSPSQFSVSQSAIRLVGQSYDPSEKDAPICAVTLSLDDRGGLNASKGDECTHYHRPSCDFNGCMGRRKYVSRLFLVSWLTVVQ